MFSDSSRLKSVSAIRFLVSKVALHVAVNKAAFSRRVSVDGVLSFFVFFFFCFPVEAQVEGGDKGMMLRRRRGLVVRALDLSSGGPGSKSSSLTLDGLPSVFK